MTEPHAAVMARLTANFATLSRQFTLVSNDLAELDRLLNQRPEQVAPQPYGQQPYAQQPYAQQPYAQLPYVPPTPPSAQQPAMPYWPQYRSPATPAPSAAQPRSQGWIGKLLAVAGVAVTLTGVVLLLVLAAQAGILRPEFRVAAGAVLAVLLVAAGWWLNTRPGGRVGAIALAATGVAAAYMDLIAVTTIYEWLSAPVGLVLAAVIAAAGLTLARRWDSEQLGLLVLVPLIVLAPVITDGFTLLLVAFMLALSAVSLPVQLGKDWIWLHAARIAAAAVPLLLALAARHLDSRVDLWVAGACGIAALLAIGSALILLRATAHRAAMALLTAAGVLPLLCVRLAVGSVVAALMLAALAAALLAIVLLADRLPGVPGVARQVFAALSAIAALLAVTVAFDERVAGPVLLALAVVAAVAGRHDVAARWVAIGFAVVGAGVQVSYAPLDTLFYATSYGTDADVATGISTLVSGALLAVVAVAVVWSWHSDEGVAWLGAGAVVVYSVTSVTVTAGTMIAGEQGFYAGHMVATICWIAMAAGLFGYAARLPRAERSVPIGGGLGLVAAATAKLFLFDLGTLDGILRVAVFIVVGLVLLGMGAGYARLLDKQDKQDEHDGHDARDGQDVTTTTD